MVSISRRRVALYVVVLVLVTGSLLGSAGFMWSQGFISQTSSAAGGQQGSQNQAAQSSISIESATFATGVLPRVSLVIRNVGAVSVTLGSITLQGTSSNAGYRGSLTDPTPSCSPSSTLARGESCTYTSTSPYFVDLATGDVVNAKVTTNVGTFAQAQLTVASGGAIGGQGNPSNTLSVAQTNQIEFFANLTLRVTSTDDALTRAESVAFSNGGYVAFSTMTNSSAYAIVRVPASSYESALTAMRSIGSVMTFSSTSNDVTIKVVNLNATLQSYLTEKAALLRLQNRTASVNDSLKIYSQLQSIDAQIDSVQSQIVNTKRLVDYSTITVSMLIAKTGQSFSLKLTTTPRTGSGQLAVTFIPTLSGGAAPYYVSYEFGDGTSSTYNLGGGASITSPQPVSHTFAPGDYNVTVSATDSSGDTLSRSVTVHVAGFSTNQDFVGFVGYVSGLFFRVVEGIIEVAAITVPIVLVLAVVVLPLGRKYLGSRGRESKQEE